MSTPGDLFDALGREARNRLGGGRGGLAVGETTRTYRARSIDELIPRIQRELGSEAIIVRRREGLTGGMLGFFQHPFVEIEAMPGSPRIDVYDEQHSAAGGFESDEGDAFEPDEGGAFEPEGAFEPDDPPPAAAQPPVQTPAPPRPVPPALERRLPLRAKPIPESAEQTPGPLPFYSREPSKPPAVGGAYVTAHLAALARADRQKGMGAHAPSGVEPSAEPSAEPAYEPSAEPAYEPSAEPARTMPITPPIDFHELIPTSEPLPRAGSEPLASHYEEPSASHRQASERRTVAPGSHGRARAGVEKSLRRLGISEELARELIDGATAHTLPLTPRSGLAQAVRTTLAQRIPVAPPLPVTGAAIVLVGAGGSGKTTCCAALLGAYRTSSTLPASCATLLREVDGGDLKMLLSPQLMKPTDASSPRALRALRAARRDGLALIDTPRLSPADRTGIRELATLIGELKPERVVVALPATLGAVAAEQLLQALAPLGANSLAITHADETDQIGVAVEAACRFALAPEYLLDRGRSGGWRLARVDPTELAVKLLR